MTEFPYAAVPTKLESLLDKIKSVGIPETVSKTWLQSIGFKSTNDPSMLPVVEFIGLVDSSRQPTSNWTAFRQEVKSQYVLADAIKRGYSSLYEVHSDAHLCTDKDLQDFFKAHSTAGEQAIARTANTFKVLCSLADFNRISENGAAIFENGHQDMHGAPEALVPQPTQIESPAPALHIDIQVHISSDAPPEQIDKIFESMAKHIYSKEAE